MKLLVQKTSALSGNVLIPGSKSQSVRGIFFAAMAKGKSVLRNVLDAEDTRAALRLVENLGAKVEWKKTANGESELIVESSGLPFSAEGDFFNGGRSGISTRFVLPMLGLAGGSKTFTLDAEEQMRARPILPLVAALKELGLEIKTSDGKLPLEVSGALMAGEVEVDGQSSQYLSALLMSLPCVEDDSRIRVKHLKERPYIEMTLQWLERLGVKVNHTKDAEWDAFEIRGGHSYEAFNIEIEGDYSSASYFLAAAALLDGDLQVNGLDVNSLQGDKRLLSLLQEMRVEGGLLRGLTIGCSDIPDLVPTLAVLGTQAEGEMRLFNVEQARFKETDRLHSMCEGLSAMGANIEILPDGLLIRGKTKLKGARVKGYEDHRTIMALALAGLLAEGETCIDTAESIEKTFPSFVTLMQSAGAKMQLNQPTIILGFKSVGKTHFGRALAKEQAKTFIDLDELIEAEQGVSCRNIVAQKGLSFFKDLEHSALKKILQKNEPVVLALGGGTPMDMRNQTLLRNHTCIHVEEAPEVVYKRILDSGWPSSFPKEASWASFMQLWKERLPVYKHLSQHV